MRCEEYIRVKQTAIRRAIQDRRHQPSADKCAVDQLVAMEQTLDWVLNPDKPGALDWIIDRTMIEHD